MNVTFDKKAFKRQIIDRELALIGKMQVIALRGRNRSFLRDAEFHRVVDQLMLLVKIEENDPENAERGKKNGISAAQLREEGRQLFEKDTAFDLFGLMQLMILKSGMDCDMVRAVVIGTLPHLREAMVREGLMPETPTKEEKKEGTT